MTLQWIKGELMDPQLMGCVHTYAGSVVRSQWTKHTPMVHAHLCGLWTMGWDSPRQPVSCEEYLGLVHVLHIWIQLAYPLRLTLHKGSLFTKPSVFLEHNDNCLRTASEQSASCCLKALLSPVQVLQNYAIEQSYNSTFSPLWNFFCCHYSLSCHWFLK